MLPIDQILAMKSILIKVYDDLDIKLEKTALEIKRMQEIKPFVQSILDQRRDEALQEFMGGEQK